MNGYVNAKRREIVASTRAIAVKHRRVAHLAAFLSGIVMWSGIYGGDYGLAIVGAALSGICGWATKLLSAYVSLMDSELAETGGE